MNIGGGKGSKIGVLSLVLEKTAQVAQIVIAIALLVLCHECSALNTLVADMKIDQGRNSPLTEILATGIQVRPSQIRCCGCHARDCARRSCSKHEPVYWFLQNGAGNTFTDMDILGLAALRNGTWIPAMVNSVSIRIFCLFVPCTVQSPRVGTPIAAGDSGTVAAGTRGVTPQFAKRCRYFMWTSKVLLNPMSTWRKSPATWQTYSWSLTRRIEHVAEPRAQVGHLRICSATDLAKPPRIQMQRIVTLIAA
jgi:hypothetical protein